LTKLILWVKLDVGGLNHKITRGVNQCQEEDQEGVRASPQVLTLGEHEGLSESMARTSSRNGAN